MLVAHALQNGLQSCIVVIVRKSHVLFTEAGEGD
jgi:hypothetical protein